MHKLLVPFAAALVLASAAPAIAHDEMPVAGQVTAITDKTIKIKTTSGQVVTLEMDGNTRVMMAGKRLTPKHLKVGQSVKALGFGDNANDLVAIDVTIQSGKGG